jgi:hypothetical protein
MNHVEAAIMDRVARLFPETFSCLEQYPERHRGYLDQVFATFDREVQFYLAYIEFKRRIEKAGLPFCYPAVTASKEYPFGRVHAFAGLDCVVDWMHEQNILPVKAWSTSAA